MRSVFLVLVVSLSIGCAGKLGALKLDASPTGKPRIVIDGPSLDDLACGVGWLSWVGEMIGADCDAPAA